MPACSPTSPTVARAGVWIRPLMRRTATRAAPCARADAATSASAPIPPPTPPTAGPAATTAPSLISPIAARVSAWIRLLTRRTAAPVAMRAPADAVAPRVVPTCRVTRQTAGRAVIPAGRARLAARGSVYRGAAQPPRPQRRWVRLQRCRRRSQPLRRQPRRSLANRPQRTRSCPPVPQPQRHQRRQPTARLRRRAAHQH